MTAEHLIRRSKIGYAFTIARPRVTMWFEQCQCAVDNKNSADNEFEPMDMLSRIDVWDTTSSYRAPKSYSLFTRNLRVEECM